MKKQNIKDIKINKDEIPLKGDGSNLFLEVMIAVSVFMFAISLAGALSINSMVSNWNTSILSSLTVQIMPVNNVNSQKAIEETMIHQNKAIDLLKTIDGIDEVTPLSDEQLQKLLKPWLGDEINIKNLPIPRLINVTLKKNANVDFMALSSSLANVSPRATLDSHKLWLSKLINFAGGLQKLAIITLLLVLMITSGAVVYTTKSSLGVHKQIINILHIMGAKDDYIAKQFAKRFGFLAIRGGIVGILIAIPTIFAISNLASNIEGGIISEASLSTLSFALIISLPIFATLISMTTAYFTVKKTLTETM